MLQQRRGNLFAHVKLLFAQPQQAEMQFVGDIAQQFQPRRRTEHLRFQKFQEGSAIAFGQAILKSLNRLEAQELKLSRQRPKGIIQRISHQSSSGGHKRYRYSQV